MSIVAAVLLAACGGGGGGGGGNPAPSPQAQTITFAQSGPLYKFAGDAAYSNTAAGGSGSGAVTYASSAPDVATVEAATGSVTIVGVGSVQISARKAADANFLAASASYVLRVAPRTLEVTAWVGSSDAELTFPSQAASLDFTRSSDLNCNPLNHTTCADGAQSTLAAVTFTDSVATMQRPAMYWLKHGPNVTRGIVAPETKFQRIIARGTVVFKDRLWVMSGAAFTPTELWSSIDGRNWRLETAELPGRPESRLVVLQDTLWLIAGASANPFGTSSEVWKSVDGKAWTQIPQLAPYPPRGFFAAAAFNGRLWVVGGTAANSDLNDVWSSADGATWERNTDAAAFSRREQHDMVAFDGRLWLIGGFLARAEVWSTTDGTNWTEETATAAFGPRFAHAVITDSQKMWLIGGADGNQTFHNDVWSSSDGKTWTEATRNAEFLPPNNPGAVAWQGKLWLIDGDVWSSTTGAQWAKNTLAAGFPRKYPAAAVGFKNRLWVLGEERKLWSSADGFDWVEETSQVPGFSPVFGTANTQLLKLNDRLILIGGLQAMSNPNSPPPFFYFREVWQSEDGRNWTKLLDAVPFKADGLTQVIEFNGKLWAFSGVGDVPYAMELWSSPDAINWTRAVQSQDAPRAAARLLVYNGQLWAIGGASSGGDVDDVSTSTDGLTWTAVDASGLEARVYGSGLAAGDKMCVYGRGSGSPLYSHDAWCSANGREWQKKADTEAPGGFPATVNGALYFVGPSAARINSTELIWKSVDGVAWRQGYRNTLRFE
jgi:hypothetical protein